MADRPVPLMPPPFDLLSRRGNTERYERGPSRVHATSAGHRSMMSLSVAIVGRGRMGTALHASLLEAGVSVRGPFSKDEIRAGAVDHANAHVVLLAVPDSAIETVARHLTPGAIVGHLSGATPLAVLEPHESFVLHPLLTVTGKASRFRGAVATISGRPQPRSEV